MSTRRGSSTSANRSRAAVAANLAAERPPFALVLRSPFPSLAAAGRVHYPYLPVTDALLLDRYRVSEALRETRAPVLVVAGDRDRIVPSNLSLRVHDAIIAPKRLAIIGGAGHNDPALAEGSALIAEVQRFLADVNAGTPLSGAPDHHPPVTVADASEGEKMGP